MSHTKLILLYDMTHKSILEDIKCQALNFGVKHCEFLIRTLKVRSNCRSHFKILMHVLNEYPGAIVQTMI